MDKCKDCKVRRDYSRLFSQHWDGEKDCPFRMICKKEEKTDGKPSEGK